MTTNKYKVRASSPHVIIDVWAAGQPMRGTSGVYIVVRDWAMIEWLEAEGFNREICEEVRRVMAELDQEPF